MQPSSLAPESHEVNPKKDCVFASREEVHRLHFRGSAFVCICDVGNSYLFSVSGNYVLKDSVKSISGLLVSGLCIASSGQVPGDTVVYFYVISCI